MTTTYRFSKIEKHKRGDKTPRRKKGNRGWRRLITIVNDYKKNQFSKIEKHKRGNNKSSWKKGNRGWRGLTRIVNDFKILV